MSGESGDPPRDNRTVFRPSPLQARREARRAAPPPPAAGAWDAQEATRPPERAWQPPRREETADYLAAPALSRTGTGPASGALAPSRLAEDDVPLPATPREVRNPLLAEAAPALSLAAGVRSGRVRIPLPQFHREVIRAIATFETAIASLYTEEKRQRAKYALCATIDDIAQNLPGSAVDGAEWARRSMVVHFFHENIGGDRFWQLVDDLLRYPGDNLDLIELYHACLAAGFEGRFREMPDGRRRLHEVMARLQAAIEHVRSLSPVELVPNWRGARAPAGRPAFWNLILFAAAGAGVLMLLAWLAFRLILMSTGDAPARALAGLMPADRLRLSRSAPPLAVADSAQKQALERFLQPQIDAHEVVVIEDGQTVRVRTTIGQLFRSGSDQLEPGKEPLFEAIGKAVDREQGNVSIEGHADSDRISVTFPDNQALSQARADTVAAIVRAQLSDPARVSTSGMGDSVPIASNDTPEGKSQNRRVEIIVPRRQ